MKLNILLNLKLMIRVPLLRLVNSFLASDSFKTSVSGIGQDITNEIMLKEAFPQCSFLGFDPESTINEILFREKIKGRFVKGAVGGRANTGNISKCEFTNCH